MINEILDFFKTVFSGSGFFSLGCNVWNSLIAYAFDMLQTNPKSLADGELWDEAYRIFLALQILGATLVSVFFMINFFKETTDIKHGMTMEVSIQFFIKLALVDAVFLNLTNILVFLIEIEQAFFGIIVPEDAASLVIRVGDDWEMSGSGLIFGNLFGLATVYKGNIIKNLIMDCQSYTKYRPNETTGGIFVSWRRKEELPTGA